MGLTLVTFNAKDLFDTGDAAHLERKLAWTAALLDRTAWDVLGLQEVGPEEVVRALLARLSRSAPAEVIVGTSDKRGIRCALLSRRPVREAAVLTSDALPFPVFREGDPPPFGARVPLRRGVVFASIDGSELGPVDVFVAHFKSRRALGLRSAAGEELEPKSPVERADAELRSLVWRAMEARFLRAQVDARLSRGSAHVVAMGDFNDVAESVTVSVVRGYAGEDGTGELLSAAHLVPEERRFSIMHGGARALIDHVLVTKGLFDRIAGVEILNGELREHAAPDEAAEGASGAEPPTVDSDHAPIVVRLG